jgi:hypothetical protein
MARFLWAHSFCITDGSRDIAEGGAKVATKCRYGTNDDNRNKRSD